MSDRPDAARSEPPAEATPETPDLARVQPPPQAPPEEADQRTAAEERQLRAKSPSAVQREAESHRDHLGDLRGRIDHHMAECERWREALAAERANLDAERRRCEGLSNDNTRLRESAWTANWVTLLGNGASIVGGGFLGVAGCWPKLIDEAKYALAGGGGMMLVCGVALSIFSHAIGRRAQK